MKCFFRILSVMLSCTISGLAVLSPYVFGEDTDISYDSTKSQKSKELSDETPFEVFDIYNAYYGITTTTTTKKTTTTTTTTTTTQTTVPTTTVTTVTTTVPTTTTATTVTIATTITTTSTTETTTETTADATTETESTETTTTSIPISPLMPEPLKRGIDVSEHQAYIDWTKVKETEQVDFVYIRAGYGKELNQVDKYLYQNIKGAKDAGIEVGLYWYSYADDTETAKREAEVCYELIKDYSFELPLYFDIEEKKHMNMTTAQASAIVDTFCTEMENRGYYVGVYSYANFLQTHIYKEILNKYDVWVAQYSDCLTAYTGHYSNWQYSSKGSIDGINGNVDVNFCYKDFSQIINQNPDPSYVTVTTTASPDIPLTIPTTARSICDKITADSTVIDWETISEREIIMLDVNITENEPNWEILSENIAGAKENSRKIGLVWNTDTTDIEKIAEEAEKLHEFVEQYQFEYPLYLDLTSSGFADIPEDDVSQLIKSFCGVFDADRKHYIGIRGYDDFLTDNVKSEIFADYDVWLITDDDSIRFGYNYGVISRLVSDVYEHECKRNYPAIMITYHLNGF